MNGTAITGFTPSTPNHLLLDAGAVYKNYGLPDEELLGATSGGNEFKIAPKLRQPKIDGLKSSYAKGMELITEVEVTLKTNMLEVTKDILVMALLGKVDESSNDDYYVITGKATISIDDYINNVALVARLSGSSTPVVIILKNALNTDGLDLKTEDDKDNTLPVTFTGHVDPYRPDDLPYEVHFPKVTDVFGLASAVVQDGKVILSFTSDVAETVPLSGFVATVAGEADVISSVVRGEDAKTIELTLTTAPTAGQAVTVAYTKPTEENEQVKSAVGTALETFSSINVVNS
ncbi:MAG: hypothetical protein LKE46_00215 [Clostridium sp.]|jgi:hypothetical protein|uniref:SwmB domain-containing protein n=1 Tax=Clostridium sp. TaxID=1506 RepID=UPI0025BF9307|nr:SwmB domain-containing protein [Clostridium sp.]MCH3962691.1 hypothetical protein [Clostridium sp.]MCI2201076.1 hypothetical protein [Clostridium sp.]